MKRFFTLLLVVAPALAPALAQQAKPLAPGEYVTEHGWGTLNLSRGKGGALKFNIEAVGANAHLCSIAGELREGKATLKATQEDDPCRVTITPNPRGVDVSSGPTDACRYYCGARAGFEGEYLRPKPGCAPSAIATTRKEFKRLYDTKRFAEARATLAPVLANCGQTRDSLDDGRLRNDLAVTLHKLGDLEACRKLLAPFAEDAALSDEEILGGLPPSDAANYLTVLRATRTNLKLCAAK